MSAVLAVALLLASPPGDSLTAQEWRDDLRYLAAEMPRRHRNLFHTIPRARPRHAYADTEAELNRLGYELLGEGRARWAALVLGFAAEDYPESANAWDSLGEARLRLGDMAGAVAAYRRSLALDSTNQHARAVLDSLGAAPAGR